MILTILHFLGFSAGIGASLSNLILGHVAGGVGPAARPALGMVSRRIGMLATGGLVLLWLTGIAQVYASWGGWAALPTLFWAKFAAVLVLTACSAVMNLTVLQALRTGSPPPPARMRLLGSLGALSAVLALTLAVAAFGG